MRVQIILVYDSKQESHFDPQFVLLCKIILEHIGQTDISSTFRIELACTCTTILIESDGYIWLKIGQFKINHGISTSVFDSSMYCNRNYSLSLLKWYNNLFVHQFFY